MRLRLLLLFFSLQTLLHAEPIKLMLLWEPQSQFAGYYIAKEKGFYKQHGLDVDLIHSRTNKNPLEWLYDGKTDYCLSWLNACLASEKNEELKHVGQIFNRSNLMLVAWKDLGINRIEDLNQKRVSIWGGMFRHNFDNLFHDKNVSPEIIDLYYTSNLFLRKGVMGCSMMHYNEYDTLMLSGVEESQLTTFFMRDLGFDLPEDGIYTLKKRWEKNPNEGKKLVEATLQGWEYARMHKEETLDLVMKHVDEMKLPTNRVHMEWMLDIVLQSVFSEDGRWTPGCLSKMQYQRTVELMKRSELFQNVPDFNEFTCQGE